MATATVTEESGRPQDQGRKHRRTGRPSAETRRLLEAWQDVQRAELRAVVAALEATAAGGILPAGDGETLPLAIPLEDPRRDRLIDRGIKVARDLGASIDVTPDPDTPGSAPATTPRPRRRKVDFG